MSGGNKHHIRFLADEVFRLINQGVKIPELVRVSAWNLIHENFTDVDRKIIKDYFVKRGNR